MKLLKMSETSIVIKLVVKEIKMQECKHNEVKEYTDDNNEIEYIACTECQEEFSRAEVEYYGYKLIK